MRTDRTLIMKLLLFAVIFIFLVSALETYARGRGSGRSANRSSNTNISRQGPARTGSMKSSDFSSSSSRNTQRSSSTERQTQRQSKSQDYKAANPDKVNDYQDTRANNANDMQQDRQDYQTDKREDWQDYGNNAQNDRQEFYDDNDYNRYDDDWEWGDNVEYPVAAMTAVAVGTALTVSAFNSMTCNPTTVYANGVAYYQCGSTWYNQAYQQGDVVYVVVDTPPGY